MNDTLLPLDRALERILANATVIPGTEILPLSDLSHRILATDITAPLDVPPADNSAMDGYALRTADCPDTGTILPISQRIAAGHSPEALQVGTAARIFTGGEIPTGADAVVIQENCEALSKSGEPDRVLVHSKPAVGDNVRRLGQDISRGSRVLAAGTLLRPQEIGLLASLGLDQVPVRKPLKVAVLTTGDELIAPGNPLQPGQIYNSNAYLLEALLSGAGCRTVRNAIVPDDPAATRQALLDAAAHADLIVSCGGVSVGEEDHLKAALQAVGRLDLWKIAIKPGKPLAFGSVGDASFLGLPGNPASAFVTFLLVALPFIRHCQGMAYQKPVGMLTPALFEKSRIQQRSEYLRARLTPDGVEIHSNQSSGVLSSACWGDGLVEWSAGSSISQGTMVKFYPYSVFYS